MGHTINQVRHFYVATEIADAGTEGKRVHIADGEKVGKLVPQINKKKDWIYFEYMSPAGQVRSDLINLSKITYMKLTEKEQLRNPLTRYKITLGGKVTEEVLLVLTFKQFLSFSEEDTQSIVVNFVPDKKGSTASDALKEIAYNLGKSLIKGYDSLVEVYLNGTEKITPKTTLKSLTGTYTSIELRERVLPFKVGFSAVRQTQYEVRPIGEGLKVEKLPLSRTDANAYAENGPKIAEMEWFYHGTRGDIYRMAGYPNIIPTEYVADASKEYYTLDIHYHFSDQGISSYNSEKDITIAAENKEDLLKIINAIKGAATDTNEKLEIVADEC